MLVNGRVSDFPISFALLLGFACATNAQQLETNSLFKKRPLKSAASSPELWQAIEPHGLSAHNGENDEAEIDEPEFESPFDEPLETERHDFTQSAKVVGRGVMQLEYGFLFSKNEEGGERETSYATPELLLRYGLTEKLEFRTRFNYAWKFREIEEDASGTTDLVFSIKRILTETEPCSCRPATAIELRLSTPTGGEDFSTERWYGGLDYIYEWELGEAFTLAGSTGGNGNGLGDYAFINPEDNRDDQFIVWSQSFALGAKLSERSTGYFEWFGLFTHGREEERDLNFLNIGVDRLLNDNLLVDFRIGWGLNEQSDDIFVGVGGAFRF